MTLLSLPKDDADTTRLHMFYQTPSPGWIDLFGWVLVGVSWVFSAVLIALVLVHLAGNASSDLRRAISRA